MARRWTPQRFTALRRLRVVICALATFALCATFFLCTTRKAVALSVNGETRHVTTYATTVTGLLREQGVDVKTHDLVQSTSAGALTNHAVVTVKAPTRPPSASMARKCPSGPWPTAPNNC